MQKELRDNILKALDEIRPFLKADGGDIELVDTDEKTVHVRLLGSCVDCAVNQMTLKSGVEMTVKKYVPQIEKVIAINDDASATP